MLIYWFTQPPVTPKTTNFASYYQYDTVTRHFCRVRLELGRAGADGGGTFASYQDTRYVGFPKTRLTGGSFAIKNGTLEYGGKPLPDKPTDGARVYDTTVPSQFVHSGNPVTESPKLVPGIEPKHLALIANDAMVTKAKINLTAGNVTPEALSAKLKGEVCRVLGVQDFATITDQQILTKLKSQAEALGNKATSDSVSSLEKALAAAKQSSALIDEQISEDLFAPSPELEKAFSALDSALGSAESSVGQSDIPKALSEIAEAQQAVKTATVQVVDVQNEVVKSQLASAGQSLTEAGDQATAAQEVQKGVESVSKAGSVDDYMKVTSGEEV